MKHTEHTYYCDECKEPIFNESKLKEISIYTPELKVNNKDFCSMNCFLKYFNTLMSEEKLDIAIAQGDDD